MADDGAREAVGRNEAPRLDVGFSEAAEEDVAALVADVVIDDADGTVRSKGNIRVGDGVPCIQEQEVWPGFAAVVRDGGCEIPPLAAVVVVDQQQAARGQVA